MTLVMLLIAVAVICLALVLAVRGGEVDAGPTRDWPPSQVPSTGPLTGGDLARVRFPVVVRGYRMADVDALLERLRAQLPPQTDARADDAPVPAGYLPEGGVSVSAEDTPPAGSSPSAAAPGPSPLPSTQDGADLPPLPSPASTAPARAEDAARPAADASPAPAPEPARPDDPAGPAGGAS